MKFNTKVPCMLYTLKGSMEKPEGEVLTKDNGFVFDCGDYRVKTVIKKHESGVFERCDTIENLSDKQITLSCALSKFSFDGGEYEVYTQYSEWCHESVGA